MEQSISRPWPWQAVLLLALLALVLIIFVPFLLFVLLPVAAVALIAWGFVAYRQGDPAMRPKAAATMVAGVALLAIVLFAVAGLTVTSQTGAQPDPIVAPATP